ncbi:MAG: PEGA domain-containing protein [Bacteroidota bacterium]
MKNTSIFLKTISLVLVGSILLSSCASSTTINSVPNGAKLYLNGESVGTTPYTHRDSKIVGSSTSVKLEKEGYETLNTSFTKDEEVDAGAVVGGIFFLFPFLWTMKYKPTRNYELKPIPVEEEVTTETVETKELPQQKQSLSKVEKLRAFKELLDEGVITEEEFEKEKKKILETDDN